jgi:PHD/YefM family antitoxin component YafN of YafNO toxin-antitoxin module
LITITPQYIKDTAGKKFVIIPTKQFNSIMEELEDLDDIKRYDAAKKRSKLLLMQKQCLNK